MAVIRRGASGDGWYAFPEEGSSFYIPPSIAQEFSLEDGMVLTGEIFSELAERCCYWQAMKKAVELLARREHSRKELGDKLKQRDFPGETVSSVLHALEQRSYLDDRRFAESWVRTRLRKKPEGRRRLASGLASKGVSRETAEGVLDGIDFDRVLAQAGEQLKSRSKKSREKLIRSLAARGFSYGEIMRFLESDEQ